MNSAKGINMALEEVTLAEVLSKGGYATAFHGKWHLGDIEQSYPHNQGFDEAFFTGTAAEVTPIREVDGRTIGSGSRGPITELLQKQYFDVVHGRSARHAHWLSPV